MGQVEERQAPHQLTQYLPTQRPFLIPASLALSSFTKLVYIQCLDALFSTYHNQVTACKIEIIFHYVIRIAQ